jgi:hypothetical protein
MAITPAPSSRKNSNGILSRVREKIENHRNSTVLKYDHHSKGRHRAVRAQGFLNSRLAAEISRKADGRYVRIACQSEHQLPGLFRRILSSYRELRRPRDGVAGKRALWARRNRP